MIAHPRFAVEPWSRARDAASTSTCSRRRSRCSRSPTGTSASAATSTRASRTGCPAPTSTRFYELRPLPYAEAGYGYPESGQTIVNVTNGKIIRLLVDDEPFDVRYGELLAHERVLDLRAGMLRRDVEWGSPAGTRARPLDPARLVRAARGRRDPVRGRAARRARCASSSSPSSSPTSRGRRSRRRPARRRRARVAARRRGASSTTTLRRRARPLDASERAAAGGRDGPRGRRARGTGRARGERGRTSAASPSRPTSQPGERLRDRQVPRLRLVEPALAPGRSATRSSPRSPRPGTPAGTGWSPAQRELPRRLLGPRRRRARRRHRAPAGRPLRALPRAPGRRPRRAAGDPAKGLTGPGYDGHTFWDTERFVLPVLTYTAPRRGRATRCAGATRRSTWPASAPPARPRGRRVPVADDPRPGVLGLLAGRHRRLPRQRRHRRRRRPLPGGRPATTPSSARSASSCSSRRRGCGARSATTTPHGALPHRRRHRPRRVQRDRRQQRLHQPDGAAEPARRRGRGRAPPAPRRASSASTSRRRRPGATPPRDMVIPYDEELGVHPQSEGFTEHQLWDFASTRAGPVPAAAALPLLRPLPQAGRQAGRPRARAALCAATPSPTRRRPATSPTTRRSPSATPRCRPARRRSIAAEVGHLELAYDYFGEAALMDLHDLEHNTRDGVHIASLAGAWIAAVAGFGGMRDHGGAAHLRAPAARTSRAPRLPASLPRPAAEGRGDEAARDATRCSTASRSRSTTTGRR